MILGMPDEEYVSCSLCLIVVQPGRQFFFSRLHIPLLQVNERQWLSPVPVGVPDAGPGTRDSCPGRRLGRARVCIPAAARLAHRYRGEENSCRATRQTAGRQLKRLPESHASNRAAPRQDARDTLPRVPASGWWKFRPCIPRHRAGNVDWGATCR